MTHQQPLSYSTAAELAPVPAQPCAWRPSTYLSLTLISLNLLASGHPSHSSTWQALFYEAPS